MNQQSQIEPEQSEQVRDRRDVLLDACALLCQSADWSKLPGPKKTALVAIWNGCTEEERRQFFRLCNLDEALQFDPAHIQTEREMLSVQQFWEAIDYLRARSSRLSKQAKDFVEKTHKGRNWINPSEKQIRFAQTLMRGTR